MEESQEGCARNRRKRGRRGGGEGLLLLLLCAFVFLCLLLLYYVGLSVGLICLAEALTARRIFKGKRELRRRETGPFANRLEEEMRQAGDGLMLRKLHMQHNEQRKEERSE
jgi:Flp pilus assembly protein TadB